MHSLKFFHDEVKRLGGLAVSEGTFREGDLLERFTAFARQFRGFARKAQKLRSEGRELVTRMERIEELCRDKGWPMPWTLPYTGSDPKWEEQRERYEWARSELVWLIQELFELMDELSPDGYYFGSHEGDGACFGYWKADEDERRGL